MGEIVWAWLSAEKISIDGATLLYKCRLCGEIDGSCHAPSGVTALVCVMQDVPLPEHWGGMPVGKTSLHSCMDGRTGVSDLVGIEPDEKPVHGEKKES